MYTLAEGIMNIVKPPDQNLYTLAEGIMISDAEGIMISVGYIDFIQKFATQYFIPSQRVVYTLAEGTTYSQKFATQCRRRFQFNIFFPLSEVCNAVNKPFPTP